MLTVGKVPAISKVIMTGAKSTALSSHQFLLQVASTNGHKIYTDQGDATHGMAAWQPIQCQNVWMCENVHALRISCNSDSLFPLH